MGWDGMAVEEDGCGGEMKERRKAVVRPAFLCPHPRFPDHVAISQREDLRVGEVCSWLEVREMAWYGFAIYCDTTTTNADLGQAGQARAKIKRISGRARKIRRGGGDYCGGVQYLDLESGWQKRGKRVCHYVLSFQFIATTPRPPFISENRADGSSK